MNEVLAKLQKENPKERILFNDNEMENLTLDKKEQNQRPTIKVHQDRYLKPVKPDHTLEKEMEAKLGNKRILEDGRKKKGHKNAKKHAHKKVQKKHKKKAQKKH